MTSAKRRLPSLNGMRAFEVAGRSLSFRLAAEELGVTHGAVAQHIRALEADLGHQLFERLPRSLVLTDVGREYLAEVTRAFEILNEATAVARGDPRQVNINVSPSFATRWLLPHLQEFRNTCPDIVVNILATGHTPDFGTANVDLAIRDGSPPFGAVKKWKLLFERKLIAVASPDLVARLGIPRTVDDFCRFVLLHDMENEWPGFLLKAYGTQQVAVEQNVTFNLATLAIDAALAGQGIAVASRLYVQRELDSGRLVQVVDTVLESERDYHVLLPLRSKNHRAAKAVWDWLMEKADRHDGQIAEP